MRGLKNIAGVLSRTLVLRLLALGCLLGSPASVLAGAPTSAAPPLGLELFARDNSRPVARTASPAAEREPTRQADASERVTSVGAIIVHSPIQSPTGGLPEEAITHTLSGLGFQVREVGSRKVVTTLVTDVDGLASAMLTPGDYEVVESGNRGLLDFTGRAAFSAPVKVIAGRVTDVPWVHRQVADPLRYGGTFGVEEAVGSVGRSEADASAAPEAAPALAPSVGGDRVDETVASGSLGSSIAANPLAPSASSGSDPSQTGWMTGGGGAWSVGNVRGSQGFRVNCDASEPSNLQVNWPGHRWHLEGSLVWALCTDDPLVSPIPPRAYFDTFEGKGVGRLNNVDGSSALFTFVDAGEPGVGRDRVKLRIWAVGADPDSEPPLLSINGVLERGNLQAHRGRPDLAEGRLRIEKTVVDADSVPVSDAPLSGFEFEIRQAGSQAVIETVVTDATGVGVSKLLDAGAYDVVESDSQDLIDLTGPTTVMVVTGDTARVDWVNEDPDGGGEGDEGRLRIEKTVVDADSVPVSDAPLSGFEFEIRQAGSQAVIETVVTDATGVGVSKLLDAGAYDVVESDSQDLIDLTGPTTVMVVTGDTARVDWVNEDPDGGGEGDEGRLRIEKTVVDADSVPVSDAPLSGFEFEIRQAGSQAVIETVVTDATGVGVSKLLDAGAYDVVESDSQDLIDLTGPTTVMVVTGDTARVDWVNEDPDGGGEGDEGRLRIEKTVVDADSVPVSDAPLSGFEFEIRQAGSQAVIETVVTDATGVGVSKLLDAGAYDVIESDSQDLIDLTGPTTVMVVTGDTARVDWVNEDPDGGGEGDEGRLRIEKTVVDADSVPVSDAPLSGFEFEIRQAGSQAVIETVVTDATGVGVSKLLDAGAYDVVESDSQDLIDLTGPTTVMVVTGDTARVDWVNEDPDGGGEGDEGRLRIEKTVVDADSVPVSDAPLSGFEFEIRQAGSQAVIETVVTDATGVGVSKLLDAGAYDVIESDSQDLIDLTGPTTVMVVTGDTARVDWVNEDPDGGGEGDEGRLRIEKTVVDADSVPVSDAPLSGFEFEIRQAGSQAVIETVVTDATGVGVSKLLDAGAYDVVESDSQDLIDLTGPTTVMVVTGDTARVDWVNEDPDGGGEGDEGRLRIEKTVVDADSVPVSDAPLSGFEFEIRQAGSQAVIETVVTDATGVGVSKLLDAGAYDVVESDSQDLIDLTGPTTVMVVTGDTARVDWVNEDPDGGGEGDEGRLRIEKTVVDADSVPVSDAPLSGFEFEIRQAGSQAVIETVVTDATGVGVSKLLDAGAYDVIESDSQDLIDLTGPTTVMVVTGDTARVDWVNEDPDGGGEGDEGRLRIEKTVVDADSVPVSDAPLSGFEFEIRQAGSQAVIETVVTDATGVGVSKLLDAGAYDVVESDSQDLIDLTGPTTVMVVTGDTARVDWVNEDPDGGGEGDEGRLRIDKTVVDADSVPVSDAPLSGFEFEIRQAGSQAVIETVVTDATGVGVSKLLDAGAYDVVESDSQDLIDLTGPTTVMVVTGDTARVDWVNEDPDGGGEGDEGRLRIDKTVVDADSVPVSDAPLSGFEFEIRQAGSQAVIETVVTDATGVGVSKLLDAGAYDVVESDSQDLIDLTGPTTVMVVTGDTARVDWVNEKAAPGAIRIWATVVDADSVPVSDAPLSGFEFEIRQAGSQAVIETLTTDDRGSALSDTLPAGTYDVVETNSHGLIDVTGPAGGGQGVVVPSGQTTVVPWVNKLTAPGVLRIQKTVVDADSVPVPDVPLHGFEFEVREQRSGSLVETLTTDEQGTAVSGPLPSGPYALVETDTRGYSDLTGPTNSTVSEGDTTEVAWINQPNPLDVGISKTGPTAAEPGDEIRYALTVSNLRPDTVHRFTVRDSLAPGVQLVSFPEGWTIRGNELRSDTLGPLAPADSVSYEVVVVATAPGTIRNVAWVHAPGDDNPSNDRSEVTTRVQVSPFSDEGLIVGRVYYTTGAPGEHTSHGDDVHDTGGDSVYVDCACEPVADSPLPDGKQAKTEVGIPGVRVYLQDGTSALTDSQGQYHFFGLRPRLWIVKIDATTLPEPELAYLVPLTNRHAGDGYSAFVDLKRSELARADFAEGSRSPDVAKETARRKAHTLMDGVALGPWDREIGTETETEYLFYSHLLPASKKHPGKTGARPPVPPGSVLSAAPQPPRRSLLATGLVEARLDLRSLANGDLGLGRGRDRFEDELQSFQAESDDGQVTAGARAALFLKGTVADDYELTFRLESEETKGSRLFRDIRPDELYPVYGDGSVREFDAQSRGRVFGRVQRGASYLTLGDFNTGLGSYGQTGSRALGQYSRTLNGVLEHYENDRVAFNAFASHDRFSQIVDELPAEGISGPYQLKRTDGLINSEKVELVTRDRDQPAVILRTQSMERFTDYTVEPFSGRLIFKQPISGLDGDLNPVSIRVTYEVEGGGDRFWIYGADGQVRPWRRVEFGGGMVRDENPMDEFDLVSLNATVDLGRGTYAFGEFTRTDGSTHGIGDASRVGIRHTSGRLTANMLFLETDSTFNNPSAAFGAGRRELNLRATAHLDEKTRLLAEGLRTEDRVSGRSRNGGRIGIERAINDWLDGRVAYRHAEESERPATDQSAESTGNVNSLAAQLRAKPPSLPRLAISAEFESDVSESDQRRAWVGADYKAWDRGRLYARHEFINSFSGAYGLNPEEERNATVLGISAAYRPGQTVFSEYRVRDAVGGREAQAAIGLRNTWEIDEGPRLSLSAERLAPISSGGTTATALTGGVEFTSDSLWLGSLRAEYWDRNGTDQVFGSVGYGRKLTSDLTFLGNAVFSKELSGDRAFERTRLGMAWRETAVNRWNALARYEHRYDADPRAADGETKREAHIFWGHLSYRPSSPLVFRATAASKLASGERRAVEFEEQSQLLAFRSTFDVSRRIDLGLIGRAVFSDFPDDAQYGLGAEVGVLLGDNLRLAVGYNAFGFSDAEFSAQESTDHGPYLQLGFKFDEALFGGGRSRPKPPVRPVQPRCPDECPTLGEIRVQKRIEAHGGGLPNNPVNPSLSGFRLEVRYAGTETAVKNLVTGSDGIASVSLEPGVYDIFEVDTHGLVDHTGPCYGVRVVAGRITRITWTNRQPPASGTITVRKRIESPRGVEVPDAPLDRFVFEVRSADPDTVVTVVTNAEGTASVLLPIGTYDVVEINARGLTDVTGPAGGGRGRVVTSGQATEVNWINVCEPPHTYCEPPTVDRPASGTITVRKRIESPRGVEVPDAPLDRFVFEVRSADPDTVVTVVTNAEGTASVLLPIGTYDVVEINARGLTDVTGPAGGGRGRVVTSGQATEVNWINVCEPPHTYCEPPTVNRPASGTITVRKRIESPRGVEVPDAPLDRFVFEVGSADPDTVVTVVTNAEGTASVLLPIGTYDVVEINARGLTDVTGPAGGGRGRVVTSGQATEVNWINVCEPPHTYCEPPTVNRPASGTITVRKRIESPRGVEVPDAPLDRFVFEVGSADLDTVVTVVTNAEGTASVLLPIGTYDVVEINARGLTDVTGPAGGGRGRVVTSGQATEVNWINVCEPPHTYCEPPTVDPPDSGTITVQKRIESPRGVEVPDAPLDSFVFEIRDTDSDTVVATLVTDSAGRASDTVPTGAYRIVEVFGPRDVEVRAGQDTLVLWTNTYPPPTNFGTITVHKRIEWPVGFESRSAPLGGFVFEVREAGSATPVTTLITDTMGMASVHLSYGTYDVVELDAQGWVDRTGPTQVRVTEPEVTRLEWVNRRPWPIRPRPALATTLGLLALLALVPFLRRRPRVTTVDRILGIKVESERRR